MVFYVDQKDIYDHDLFQKAYQAYMKEHKINPDISTKSSDPWHVYDEETDPWYVYNIVFQFDNQILGMKSGTIPAEPPAYEFKHGRPGSKLIIATHGGLIHDGTYLKTQKDRNRILVGGLSSMFQLHRLPEDVFHKFGGEEVKSLHTLPDENFKCGCWRFCAYRRLTYQKFLLIKEHIWNNNYIPVQDSNYVQACIDIINSNTIGLVAVGCHGNKLMYSEINFVVISTQYKIYIFDTKISPSFFKKGNLLSDILENTLITKVVFDNQRIGDVLLKRYHIKIRNVFDLKMCDEAIQEHMPPEMRIKLSYPELMDRYLDLPSQMFQESEKLQTMFHAERPACEFMKRYAALSVAFHLPLYYKFKFMAQYKAIKAFRNSTKPSSVQPEVNSYNYIQWELTGKQPVQVGKRKGFLWNLQAEPRYFLDVGLKLFKKTFLEPTSSSMDKIKQATKILNNVLKNWAEQKQVIAKTKITHKQTISSDQSQVDSIEEQEQNISFVTDVKKQDQMRNMEERKQSIVEQKNLTEKDSEKCLEFRGIKKQVTQECELMVEQNHSDCAMKQENEQTQNFQEHEPMAEQNQVDCTMEQEQETEQVRPRRTLMYYLRRQNIKEHEPMAKQNQVYCTMEQEQEIEQVRPRKTLMYYLRRQNTKEREPVAEQNQVDCTMEQEQETKQVRPRRTLMYYLRQQNTKEHEPMAEQNQVDCTMKQEQETEQLNQNEH